jgi:probable rRNA maturation factor
VEIGIIIDEEYAPDFDPARLENIIRRVLEMENTPDNTEMGLVITSAEVVSELAREYLKDDAAHDVLTFSFKNDPRDVGEFILPADGLQHLGEVIISYPQAVIQAGEQGHPVKTEVIILIIHGILHLLGYDHAEPAEEQKMGARAAAIQAVIDREFP